MTPNFHTPLTPFPLDLKEDQHQQIFILNSQSSASPSSSTHPCVGVSNPAQEQAGGYYHMEPYHLQHQQEVINDKHVNSYDDFNYMTIADVLSLF